jgi:hypothetical protein
MSMFARRLLLIIVSLGLGESAPCATITTTDFRQLNAATFTPIEGPISESPRTWPVGGVNVLSPRASILGGTFAFVQNLSGSDPSGSATLGYENDRSPAVFNLSSPVAALGVTFNFSLTPGNAVLRAFDQSNGTGKLLGTVTSVRIAPPYSATNRGVDFVAIWSDSQQIRSFVIEGTTADDRVSITGFATSLKPIPEPSSPSLAMIALTAGASSWRRYWGPAEGSKRI